MQAKSHCEAKVEKQHRYHTPSSFVEEKERQVSITFCMYCPKNFTSVVQNSPHFCDVSCIIPFQVRDLCSGSLCPPPRSLQMHQIGDLNTELLNSPNLTLCFSCLRHLVWSLAHSGKTIFLNFLLFLISNPSCIILAD